MRITWKANAPFAGAQMPTLLKVKVKMKMTARDASTAWAHPHEDTRVEKGWGVSSFSPSTCIQGQMDRGAGKPTGWTDRARDSLNVHGDPELMIQDTKPKLLLKNAQAHMEKMMQLLVTNKYHFPLISLQEPVPLLFVCWGFFKLH